MWLQTIILNNGKIMTKQTASHDMGLPESVIHSNVIADL